MLRINKEQLVMQSISGKIHHPERASMNYALDVDGKLHVFPATGGITYNKNVGDCAFYLEGDHVEPSVSCNNSTNSSESLAFMTLSCSGNYARVLSGDAKGAIGYVLGKHGGIDNVIIQFAQSDMEKMAPSDSVLIKSIGQGLKLIDYPEIKVMNLDPDLLQKLEIECCADGTIGVPVAVHIPAGIMGSGTGSSCGYVTDVDLMTQDKEKIRKYGIDKLCFGDFVLIDEFYTEFGTTCTSGAVTVGIVVHSDCVKNGHGPGITPLLTCRKTLIKPLFGKKCNIGDYIKL